MVFDRAAFAACLADYGEVAACVDEEYVDARRGRDRMGDLRLSMPACGAAADVISDDAAPGGSCFGPARPIVDERELKDLLVHLDYVVFAGGPLPDRRAGPNRRCRI